MNSFRPSKLALCLLTALASAGTAMAAPVGETDHKDGSKTITGAIAYEAVTPTVIDVDLRTLPRAAQWQPGDPIKIVPRRTYGGDKVSKDVAAPTGPDPLTALQDDAIFHRGVSGIETPLLNFDSVIGFTGVQPPDPAGAAGKDYYIESINGSGGARVVIYDKTDGSVVSGPFSMDSLGTGSCASGLGDPIIFWDALAERFVITEFTSVSNHMCVYVQIDPNDLISGGWYEYQFLAPNFPDYPKYGAWSDAYYVGSNEGGPSPAYAFEREPMLVGDPATFQRFTAPDLSGFGFQLLVPAHHAGLTPPPKGAPGIFMRHRDDESHNPGSANPTEDYLEIWEFSVDWDTPSNSTFTGPTNLAISEFDSNCFGLTAFECFPQPSGGRLDPLREPIMWPLWYRNDQGHQTLVANLLTDVDGNDRGGVRWFELRQAGRGGWSLYQEGTMAPGSDDLDRWMGSAAMDESGNIAVGYSVVHDSAPALAASLRYAGREAGDPLGMLPQGEYEIVEGTGSQSGVRWGDYSSMTVDPEDGCTFWYANEYVNGGNWLTRVASFRFDACGSPTFTLAADNLSQEICAPGDLDDINLAVLGRQGYMETVDLGPIAFPTGFSGSITPDMVVASDPAAMAVASLSVDGTASPGDYVFDITASGPAVVTRGPTTIERSVELSLSVFNATPGTPTLTAPADMASTVALRPTFEWTAASQGGEYVIEVDDDPGFGSIDFTTTVTGTNVTPVMDLMSSTTYYWRVVSSNTCGLGTSSAVFSFETQPLPGDCPAGEVIVTLSDYDFESGAQGWTSSGTSDTWALESSNPASGTQHWHGDDVGFVSDQRLTSPVKHLPTQFQPYTFQFMNFQEMEDGGAGCYDGGFLEVSVDGGPFTAIANSDLATDPYDGPLDGGFDNPAAGQEAWCGDPQAYLNSVVDINTLAGSDVQFRFRLATDASVSRPGWDIDDVKIRGCAIDLIFDDGLGDD